jgi:hypothetical protein
LDTGTRVEIIHHGRYIQTGVLQDAAPDGKALWVILDHGMGRIFVTEGDRVALVPLDQDPAS